MLEKKAESFYTVWIQEEEQKVVIEVGNQYDDQPGLEDFVLTADGGSYVDPSCRFKVVLSIDATEELIAYLYQALCRLQEKAES